MAKLAGVPAETIRQARAYLARLDQFNARRDAPARSVRARSASAATASTRSRATAAIDPTPAPRDALAALTSSQTRSIADAMTLVRARRAATAALAPRARERLRRAADGVAASSVVVAVRRRARGRASISSVRRRTDVENRGSRSAAAGRPSSWLPSSTALPSAMSVTREHRPLPARRPRSLRLEIACRPSISARQLVGGLELDELGIVIAERVVRLERRRRSRRRPSWG